MSDSESLVIGIIVGFICFGILMGIIYEINDTNLSPNEFNQLGADICQLKAGLDFKDWEDGVLYCESGNSYKINNIVQENKKSAQFDYLKKKGCE